MRHRDKLTVEDINEIVRLRNHEKPRWSLAKIARKFKVDHTSIIYWLERAEKHKLVYGNETFTQKFDQNLRDAMFTSVKVPSVRKKRGRPKGAKDATHIQRGASTFRKQRIFKSKRASMMYSDHMVEDRGRALKEKQDACPHRAVPLGSDTCFLCGFVVKKKE